MTSTAATGARTDVRAASQDGPGDGPDAVRAGGGGGGLRPYGRRAGRSVASRAEAEAGARPEEGEQVVELNVLCDCDL